MEIKNLKFFSVLGVAAVAGVFILLGVGMILGLLILFLEHLFYKYTLPVLRHQPKGTIWRSRNIMFFSQVSNIFTLFYLNVFSWTIFFPIRRPTIVSYFSSSYN